ncbi:MAG: tetratricopeptide repeat protein, partial [Candidatus Sericytochromatia bacterium]
MGRWGTRLIGAAAIATFPAPMAIAEPAPDAFEQGKAASAAGRHDEALAHFRRHLEASRAAGDDPGIYRALSNVGFSLRDLGRDDEAIAALDEAAALGRRYKLTWPLVQVVHPIGRIHAANRRTDRARVAFDEAIAILRQLQDRQLELAVVLSDLGAVEDSIGRYPKAHEAYAEAVA